MILEADETHENFGRRAAAFLETIKFSHSIFALPFALVSMLAAWNGVPPFRTIFWIVIACVSARTAAMCFNRVVDAKFDANNPRTEKRALVTGELSREFVIGVMAASIAIFYFSAAMLNRECFILSTPTLAVLLGYSLTKRFTDLSHYALGAALGLAPIGAWVAVLGGISLTPVFLAAAVVLWVAGFDILYSCQDFEIDSANEELHSLPKRLGIAGAMNFARRTHAVAMIFFLLFWIASPLGVPALIGILAIGLLLAHQHRLLRPNDLSRMDAAFFTTNGVISAGFLVLVLIDVLAG
ncbi:putative 4-hydroxybenzoate polyprenyltransferase [soil metagenome]